MITNRIKSFINSMMKILKKPEEASRSGRILTGYVPSGTSMGMKIKPMAIDI